MLSLQDALGIPSKRVPISPLALAYYMFPPFVCSFTITVLVLVPHTRPARVALWPIMALLAIRAVASLDMSLGIGPAGRLFHSFFMSSMFILAVRTLDLTLTKEPPVRYLRPANSSPSIIADAIDLSLNLRGYGWNWSNGLYIPRETRPRDRTPFVFYTLISAVVHAFAWAVLWRAIQSFAHSDGHATTELTVFDETLPFLLRYFRTGIMTAFMGLISYASLQTDYDLATIVGVVVFRQDPSQWPPIFDAPWRATSLSDFWGRRWHQWHRRMFLFLGGYPLSALLGRTGIVLGAFLASAVLHDILLAGIDKKLGAWRMFAAFGMMAPGMLAERAFYRLTGKKVGGVAGWVWTMTWLLAWNSLMLDGFDRAGIFGNSGTSDSVIPLRAVLMFIERGVVNFDTWLHSI